MEITFDQYIANPIGKKSAVIGAAYRETMRKVYTHKLDNIMLREKGKIDYNLYKDSKHNTYWAHIKVPSETVDKFYYDVIIKFSATQSTMAAGSDLFKYNAQFFSNDPAFVYTYCYAFVKADIFIKELSRKMNREALRRPATEKNPNADIGYVKTIYFAYLIMQNRSLNKLSKFNAECKELVPQELLQDIMPADEKIRDRQEEGSKVSHRKKVVLDKKTYNAAKKYMTKETRASDNLRVVTSKKVKAIKPIAKKRGILSNKK